MVRRVIRKLKIIEVSGVDRPANAHARAAIIKRHDGAHIGDSNLDYSKIDLGALADIVLTGAAVALRKREPGLSPEQAYAKIYTSPDYRLAAEAEREAAKRLLAGVPVARLEPKILDSLDDDEVNELTVEIKNANPWMTDADLIRAVANSAEERAGRAAVRENVRQATREGSRVPQPGDTLSSRSTDGGVRKRDDALDAITAKAAELRKADSSLSEAQAFARAYSDPSNRALAKAERAAAMDALNS
jgi:hypothetical protein